MTAALHSESAWLSGISWANDAARRWVPVPEWLMEEIEAAHVGHIRKSLTLDTYAHVLVDD